MKNEEKAIASMLALEESLSDCGFICELTDDLRLKLGRMTCSYSPQWGCFVVSEIEGILPMETTVKLEVAAKLMMEGVHDESE